MSRDRLKQEAALIVLDRIMEAVGEKIAARFEATGATALQKSLAQFEESRARVIGGVAEAISEGLALALGPDRGPLEAL